MSESDNIQLKNVIEEKKAQIRELEEQIKVLEEKIIAHDSKIKKLTQEHQSLAKDLEKEKKDFEKEKKDLEKEKKDLEKKIKDLEKEVKKLKTWNSAKDSNLSKIQEKVRNNEISHDEEMKRLKENTSTELEKLKAIASKLTKKLEEKQQQCNQHLEHIKTLQEENNNLTVPNSLEQCYLCIGQLCSDLQAKMYQRVLPDSYSRGWSYKFKYIEQDIESTKDGDPRKGQAKTRLESLKNNIKWEKKYERVIKFIQRRRNQVAHPEILNAEAARRAVQQLKVQGKLKGKINIERVFKLIEMWEYLST